MCSPFCTCDVQVSSKLTDYLWDNLLTLSSTDYIIPMEWWKVPTAFPGIRYSLSLLRVMSATTPSCGTIVALDSSDP